MKRFTAYFIFVTCLLGVFLFNTMNRFMSETRFYTCQNYQQTVVIFTDDGSYIHLSSNGSFYKDNYYRKFLNYFKLLNHKNTVIVTAKETISIDLLNAPKMECRQIYSDTSTDETLITILTKYRENLVSMNEAIQIINSEDTSIRSMDVDIERFDHLFNVFLKQSHD